MRVVFMGTPQFAVPCLQALIDAGHEVCGVFTQPDKPKGRGYKLAACEVKELAQTLGLAVFQPAKLREDGVLETLTALEPEVIVVVAYGKILPKEILKLPPLGCINVHGSLLPKYRGAAPIQWAVLNGDEKTGITTMYMDEGLDTGDMLLTEEVDVLEDETSSELYERLSHVGARVLIDTLENLPKITPQKQPADTATYAPMLDKTLSQIDWNKSAHEVHNLVRGLQPWPVAATTLGGKQLKIHKTRKTDVTAGAPGEVVSISPFVVGCAHGTAIEILEVQYEGKKRMPIADFLRGRKVAPKTRLGVEL